MVAGGGWTGAALDKESQCFCRWFSRRTHMASRGKWPSTSTMNLIVSDMHS